MPWPLKNQSRAPRRYLARGKAPGLGTPGVGFPRTDKNVACASLSAVCLIQCNNKAGASAKGILGHAFTRRYPGTWDPGRSTDKNVARASLSAVCLIQCNNKAEGLSKGHPWPCLYSPCPGTWDSGVGFFNTDENVACASLSTVCLIQCNNKVEGLSKGHPWPCLYSPTFLLLLAWCEEFF